MKELQPHVARMVAELDELSNKVKALGNFAHYDNEVFCSLPEVEQEVMIEQLEAMERYQQVLSGRVDRATGKAHKTI